MLERGTGRKRISFIVVALVEQTPERMKMCYCSSLCVNILSKRLTLAEIIDT